MSDRTDDLAASPHTNDGFFKAIFSQPEHATAFFKSHLPASLTEIADWSTLSLIPASFVKSSLQQVHADLLFSIKIGDRQSLLYLLFEHQSKPDPAMPLRLLAYMTEIFTRHHKSHGLPLPPVLPFVLHQGPETWNVSTEFADLFQLPPQLAEPLSPYLPKFHHALLDLTSFDPSANENNTSLRVVLQLMKLSRRKELLRFFQWLAKFPARELPESFLGLLLLYALHSDSDLDAEQIYHTLSTNPELEKSAMSVAEKLKAQGHSDGLLKGRSEGRAIGLWIGKIQAYEEFLGKNPSPRETLDHLSIPQLEALHQNLREEYESRFKRPE